MYTFLLFVASYKLAWMEISCYSHVNYRDEEIYWAVTLCCMNIHTANVYFIFRFHYNNEIFTYYDSETNFKLASIHRNFARRKFCVFNDKNAMSLFIKLIFPDDQYFEFINYLLKQKYPDAKICAHVSLNISSIQRFFF